MIKQHNSRLLTTTFAIQSKTHPFASLASAKTEQPKLNNLNLLTLLWEKLSINKQKQLKIKEKKQVDALTPEEIKPKETKPVEYGDYFLNGLAEIDNSPQIDFNNLKQPNSPIGLLALKVHYISFNVI